MDNILTAIGKLWFYFASLGILIPIICYLFSGCLNKILTLKTAKNRYTSFIPLFSGVLGVVIAAPENIFLVGVHSFLNRVVLGFFLGLSATGLHQLHKKIKMFFAIKKIKRQV